MLIIEKALRKECMPGEGDVLRFPVSCDGKVWDLFYRITSVSPNRQVLNCSLTIAREDPRHRQ